MFLIEKQLRCKIFQLSNKGKKNFDYRLFKKSSLNYQITASLFERKLCTTFE